MSRELGDGSKTMTDQLLFTLDGKKVLARPGETIWQVAKREGRWCWDGAREQENSPGPHTR